MPTGFEPAAGSNTNTSDTDGVVSIGRGVAARHTTTGNGGVAVGQNLYGASADSGLDLAGGILIGKDIMKNSTSAADRLAKDSVFIGRDICDTTTTSAVRDSVIVGSKAATNLENDKVVAIGSQCLRYATVSSEAVAVGYAAGQGSIVGSSTVLLGRSCGRNLSGDSSYTIGNDSIFIGTGPINDSMAAIPGGSDLIMIGRDVCPVHATDNGQIRLGNSSNHTSALIDVDASIKLQTDSLVNVQTTPTSTTLRATDTALTHKISLECGSKTVALNSVGLTTNCPLILPSNGIICSAAGKSYMPGTYWASGSALDGTEKRHIIIKHNSFGIDSSHHAVVMAPYGNSLTTGSTIDPLNSIATTKDDYSLFMSRLSQHSNEMHVFVPSIPSGFQVVRYKVLCNQRQNNTTSPPVLLSARSVFYSRSMANTGSSSRASAYVSSHVDATNGTNVFISLDTPFVGSPDHFGVIFLPFTSADSMVLAVIVEIERV